MEITFKCNVTVLLKNTLDIHNILRKTNVFIERQNIKCEVTFEMEMEMTYPRMIDFCEWRQSERSDVGG